MGHPRILPASALVFALVLGCGDGDADESETTGGSGDTAADSGSATSAGPSSATSPSSDSATSGPATSADSGATSADDGVDASTGGGEPAGSAGCGIPATDATMQWGYHTVDVDGVMREYWVWLPEPYDPALPYPVVYQFHGCADGDNPQSNNPPVQDQSGADAIHIRGRAVDSCWEASPGGPDVAFFDAMVADVEATWCADAARRFATGYSSGSFMTHRLGCERADMLRGVATIAGGSGGNDCPGRVAALLIHYADDPTVNISASIAARDLNLARNNCDAAAPTNPVDPPPCESYTGCDDGYPVVWCQTSGQGHSRQDGLSGPAFWGFLSALPAE
jgi:poly(3-hydroxybutyrate) depolymerase